MLIFPTQVIDNYVRNLNDTFQEINSDLKLSRSQSIWLSVVLTGIVVTGKLCWALFERRSMGLFGQNRLRWMFVSGSIAWQWILQASLFLIIKEYGITHGVLVIDDTKKHRSGRTKKIPGVHKIKDKSTGGFFVGQELVFMVLVTQTVTVPVGFRFYEPDPAMTEWNRTNNKLKKKGIPAKQRPKRPKPNPDYPTKQTLALELVKEFQELFFFIEIKALLADALYSNKGFVSQAEQILPDTQIISRLRSNQIIHYRNRKRHLKTFFSWQKGVRKEITIRGGVQKTMIVLAARLHLQAHGKKRFIIAVRYEEEKEYRFLVASDMTWHHEDILRTFSLRWLIEVFIEDWKQHEGWNRLAKHQGVEGSMRGVTLSLLCDHMLLLVPEQLARLKNKQPGLPTGCLIEQIKVEALIQSVLDLLNSSDPQTAVKQFSDQLKECLPERDSLKHMAGKELGRIGPAPSLKYKNNV